jgi:hypothetical protein
MSTVTVIEREVALLVEREPRNDSVFFLRSPAALINDAVVVTPNATERDVAQLGDSTSETSFARERDPALLLSRASNTVSISRNLRETARLRSRGRPSVRVYETVNDVLTGRGEAVHDIVQVLRDTAQLDDITTISGRPTRSLRETAKIYGRARLTAGLSTREVAELNDNADPRVRARQNERDVAQLNDITDATVRQSSALVREVAQFTDRAVNVATTSAALRDVFFIADETVLSPRGKAYTCSVRNWGMSSFTNYPFRTMAGDFVAGENLWRLGADDDYGTPIEAYIRTGFTDAGVDKLKRLAGVYVAGSSDAPLSVSVVGDVNGVQETVEYELELRDQDNYRNNRAVVGKGFRSRFVQLKLGATNVKYKLLSAELDVAVTARRV